jgi:hypothetical protein
MVSHETKRVLGIASLVLILILLLARGLPHPFPGSAPWVLPRNPGGSNGFAPALIFSGNISVANGTPTFNLTLRQSHSYMWKFNVTFGSVKINLTDPKSGNIFWTVGPFTPLGNGISMGPALLLSTGQLRPRHSIHSFS